jgi:hypothetical protein
VTTPSGRDLKGVKSVARNKLQTIETTETPTTTESSERRQVRNAMLKAVWQSAKSAPSFSGTGHPEIDAETTACWGPWDAPSPFAEPFNGGPVPEEYRDLPAMIDFGSVARAVTAAKAGQDPTTDGRHGKLPYGQLSKWGKAQVASLREIPGFNETPQGQLSDYDLLWTYWATYQKMTGPNRLQRFAAECLGQGPKLSKWAQDAVAQVRSFPGFDQTGQAKLSDAELAQEIRTHWERLSGPNKSLRIVRFFLTGSYDAPATTTSTTGNPA